MRAWRLNYVNALFLEQLCPKGFRGIEGDQYKHPLTIEKLYGRLFVSESR